jgi:hypothetical protein
MRSVLLASALACATGLSLASPARSVASVARPVVARAPAVVAEVASAPEPAPLEVRPANKLGSLATRRLSVANVVPRSPPLVQEKIYDLNKFIVDNVYKAICFLYDVRVLTAPRAAPSPRGSRRVCVLLTLAG